MTENTDLLVETQALETMPAAGLFQSRFWGLLKAEFGWKPLAFRIERGLQGSGREAFLLVLYHAFPGGHGLAYVPHGPDLGGEDPGAAFLETLSRKLAGLLPRGTMLIRFDVPWGLRGENNFPLPLGKPFRRAVMDIQPPDTVILDLAKSDEDLLEGMKPKTRYNIRLAEKKGVEIVEAGEAGMDEWYALYEETARRDRIAIHGRDYYGRIFSLAREMGEGAPKLRLLSARYEGETLAGIVTAVFGSSAYYLYGASSDSHRNLMPSYLLQWRAIAMARSDGASTYDFFGIPPADDPNHPMYGLYRFKTGFGGDIVHRPGSWDFPASPYLYAGYRFAEFCRNFYFKKMKKAARRARPT